MRHERGSTVPLPDVVSCADQRQLSRVIDTSTSKWYRCSRRYRHRMLLLVSCQTGPPRRPENKGKHLQALCASRRSTCATRRVQTESPHTHTHTHTPCLTKNKSQLTNCSSPPHFGIQIPIPSTMTIPQPRKARIPQPRKAEDGSWTQSHKSWVFAENVHAVVQELEVSWARAGGIKLRAAERDVLLLRLQPRWVRARLSLLACTRRLKVPATATVHPSPWFWLRGTSSRRR